MNTSINIYNFINKVVISVCLYVRSKLENSLTDLHQILIGNSGEPRKYAQLGFDSNYEYPWQHWILKLVLYKDLFTKIYINTYYLVSLYSIKPYCKMANLETVQNQVGRREMIFHLKDLLHPSMRIIPREQNRLKARTRFLKFCQFFI